MLGGEKIPRPPSTSYKSRDRGPHEIKSRLHEEEGEIMEITTKEVVTIPPSLPIKNASEKMVENRVRRLPVVSAGQGHLKGILVTRDIVDFLGGGEKYQIITEKHEGNFLSAINDSSKLIINRDAPYADTSVSISEVAKMLDQKGVGGVPILGKEDKIKGIVTERDFASYMPSPAQISVEKYMSTDVVTVDPDLFVSEAMKTMISEGFRRLPVTENGTLEGILTSMDVLEYFGTNEMFKHMKSGSIEEALSIEIEEIMTKDPVTANPREDLGEVGSEMRDEGYGGFPVLENNELVGIITERDILEVLL